MLLGEEYGSAAEGSRGLREVHSFLAKTEVGDDHVPKAVEQQVLWLQVPGSTTS